MNCCVNTEMYKHTNDIKLRTYKKVFAHIFINMHVYVYRYEHQYTCVYKITYIYKYVYTYMNKKRMCAESKVP